MSKVFFDFVMRQTVLLIIKHFDNRNKLVSSALISLGICGHLGYTFGTTNTQMIDIKKKYTFTRNGYTEFMLIDKKENHYNVNNSLWYWKWDSIEDWHKLNTPSQLTIKYYGWRVPILGLFPNIVMTNEEKVLEDISQQDCRVIKYNYHKEKAIKNGDSKYPDWNILAQTLSDYDDKYD